MKLFESFTARWLGMQRPKYARRAENRKFLTRGQIAQRLVEGFGIFNFGARNCEMWVDLAADAASIPRQVHQMRVQQPGGAAKFKQRTLDGLTCGARRLSALRRLGAPILALPKSTARSNP